MYVLYINSYCNLFRIGSKMAECLAVKSSFLFRERETGAGETFPFYKFFGKVGRKLSNKFNQITNKNYASPEHLSKFEMVWGKRN